MAAVTKLDIRNLFLELEDSISFEKLFGRFGGLFEEISRLSKRTACKGGITYVLAVGKSATAMSSQLMASSNLSGDVRGVISAPYESEKFNSLPLNNWQTFSGGHPIPNSASLDAAFAAAGLLNNTTSRDLTLFLISGGASAAFEAPISSRISLKDLQSTYATLIDRCETIDEMNSIRMEFSLVKGGRLAAMAYPSRQISILLSDVAEELAAIGSGVSMYCPEGHLSTVQRVIEEYSLLKELPSSVSSVLCENSKDRIFRNDQRLCHSEWHCLASNRELLNNLKSFCERQGWETEIDTSCDELEVGEAAKKLVKKLTAHQGKLPFAIVSGGEMISRNPVAARGKGGRNSAFVMASLPLICGKNIVVGSWASDGRDGSGQGGAVADSKTLQRSRKIGLDFEEFQSNGDSFGFFDRLDDAIICDPTNHNLRDARILVRY